MKKLRRSAPGPSNARLQGAVSDPFQIMPAGAARLVVLGEPGTGEGQDALDPPFVVAIADGFGNRVTDTAQELTVRLAGVRRARRWPPT